MVTAVSCGTPRSCKRVHAAQLFTGNTAFLPVAVIERRASMRQLAVNWAASFCGNLAGALLAVVAVSGAGLVSQSGPAVPVALAKVSLPFPQVSRPFGLFFLLLDACRLTVPACFMLNVFAVEGLALKPLAWLVASKCEWTMPDKEGSIWDRATKWLHWETRSWG